MTDFPANVAYTLMPTSAAAIPALPSIGGHVDDVTLGTRTTRISSVANRRNSYARFDAWNCDGTLLLLGGADSAGYAVARMLDGNTYADLGAFSPIACFTWSRVLPNVAYGVTANKLVKQDATTGSITTGDGGTVHTFTGYTTVLIGGDIGGSAFEGGISDDDRYIALTAYPASGSKHLLVYDLVGGTIVGDMVAPAGMDNAQISRLGNYVVVVGGGETRVWPRALTGSGTQLWPSDNHGDNALNAAGQEIFVSCNVVLAGPVAAGVRSYRLSDGLVTQLLPAGTAFEYGHVCGRSIAGWVGLSVLDYGATTGRYGVDLVVAVKTDPGTTMTVRIYGYSNHRIGSSPYNAQPMASWSRDMKKAIVGSPWSSSTSASVYAFILESIGDGTIIGGDGGGDEGGGGPDLAIIQSASFEKHTGWTGLAISGAYDNPTTPGSLLVAIESGYNENMVWGNGFVGVPLVDQTPGGAGSVPNAARISVAMKEADGSETTVGVSWPTPVIALATLHIFELPAGSTFDAAVYLADAGTTVDFPTVTPPAGDPVLLLALVTTFQGYGLTGHDADWTPVEENTANNGSNSIVTGSFVQAIESASGSYSGDTTYAAGVSSGAVILSWLADVPPPPPPPPPGDVIIIHDPDDVVLGTLSEAFDVQVRIELNSTGFGQFKINRHSVEALADLLKPGNYVRFKVPQIDPDAIFGFFLEAGATKLISSDEEGGEVITFGGRGGLAYWDRAIWLAESFLVPWWPQYPPYGGVDPPAAAIGALSFQAGWYRHYSISGTHYTTYTKFHTEDFTAYYDTRKKYTKTGNPDRWLVHLISGVYSGFYVAPFGAGVFNYPKKSQYALGPSITLAQIAVNQMPGEVIEVMYEEAIAADRPIHPLPLMTVDFSATEDSNGDPWTVLDAVSGLSAELGDDYLSTIGKLVNLGVVDVVMGPDLDMHAYNAYGRDLTGSAFGPGVVRFAKGANIADELQREFSDSPVGTFAEVLGNEDGAIARVELPDAASRTPREISVRGETADTSALEDLGLAQLQARLLHSDAIGFAVEAPIVGQEDPDGGRYLPGPPGSDNGNYWIGDLVTLHTGTGENDFEEDEVRIAAITISFDDANNLKVVVELNSGFGGFQEIGGSSGGSSTSTTGGAPTSTLSDLYQLLSERDQPNGYPSLDEGGLVDPSQLPTQWKQSVRLATTAAGTLATDYAAGQVVDGGTLVDGDDLLIKDAADASKNGVYLVNATGAPTRRADFDDDVDVLGAVVRVREGTDNAGTVWLADNLTDPVIDTDDITFSALMSSSSSGGFVPTYIGPLETFIVPAYRQALFSMAIDNQGILEVDGFLVEVS